MTDRVSIEDITALVLQAHYDKGGSTLPPSAYHKILHFVNKELEDHDIETEIRQFWYMYGKVTAISNTQVQEHSVGDRNDIRVQIMPDEISARPAILDKVEDAVESGVDLYWELGLDGLIRESYEDAPHELQREFLDLKAQLEVGADENKTTLSEFTGESTNLMRDQVYNFIEHFPSEEYPEFEADLYSWYRLLSAELDSEDYDPKYALRLTEKFWRLFCLELACRYNDDVSPEEIADELEVEGSVEDEIEDIRSWFLKRKQNKAERNARKDDIALKAATAAAIPAVGFEG